MVNCPVCGTAVALDRIGGKPCYEHHYNGDNAHCPGSIQLHADAVATVSADADGPTGTKLSAGDTFTADNITLRIVEGPDGGPSLVIDDTSEAEFYILDEDVSPDRRAVNYCSDINAYVADDLEGDA